MNYTEENKYTLIDYLLLEDRWKEYNGGRYYIYDRVRSLSNGKVWQSPNNLHFLVNPKFDERPGGNIFNIRKYIDDSINISIDEETGIIVASWKFQPFEHTKIIPNPNKVRLKKLKGI